MQSAIIKLSGLNIYGHNEELNWVNWELNLNMQLAK